MDTGTPAIVVPEEVCSLGLRDPARVWGGSHCLPPCRTAICAGLQLRPDLRGVTDLSAGRRRRWQGAAKPPTNIPVA